MEVPSIESCVSEKEAEQDDYDPMLTMFADAEDEPLTTTQQHGALTRVEY